MPLTKDEQTLIEKSCAEHLHNLLGRLVSQTTLPSQTESFLTVGQVKQAFTDSMIELLDFKYVGYPERVVQVVPKKYIADKKTWSGIGAIVRELGGGYVSNGKNSRFEIPVVVKR